jgi:hypothetical protein
VASTPVAVSRPMAEKLQPTALPGRWVTMTTPTTMNPAKATSRLLSCSKLPLATDRGTPTP